MYKEYHWNDKKKLFKDMFGYFNQGIYNMMTNKFKKLFEDDIALQEFASKIESDDYDAITAQEFRKMSGWERYMVAEQYAMQKAKDYDKYVYDAYETTKIDVIRDGQPATVGHMDNLSLQEQSALDAKIKFEYAKQFAGLNPAMVATIVKPEIDKFDEARRKNKL